MAIQTSSKATAGNLTKYETEYRMGADARRTYDQLAVELNKTFEPNGVTTQVAWATPLVPRPTTAIGSETADFEPQTWIDTTTSITKVYINDGFKRHELQELKSSLNVRATNAELMGRLAMETVDAIARRAATEGSVAFFGDLSASAHTSRSTLDLGTANDRLTFNAFSAVSSFMANWQHENDLVAIITPFQYNDLLVSGTGNLFLSSAGYTERGKEILYNFEVGQAAGIRIVRSPLAKRFYGAGAANASAVSTTVAASTTANLAGARTIEVAANTNIVAGMWLTVGTVQSSTESDDTLITEAVYVNATPSGTTVSITGSGPGGGLMYTHAVGATVKNNDSVHCAVFGHSESLAVDFAKFGRYGQPVAPFQDGNAKQWETHAFKYFGNYGRLDESQIIRVETSSSVQ